MSVLLAFTSKIRLRQNKVFRHLSISSSHLEPVTYFCFRPWQWLCGRYRFLLTPTLTAPESALQALIFTRRGIIMRASHWRSACATVTVIIYSCIAFLGKVYRFQLGPPPLAAVAPWTCRRLQLYVGLTELSFINHSFLYMNSLYIFLSFIWPRTRTRQLFLIEAKESKRFHSWIKFARSNVEPFVFKQCDS